MNLQQAKAAAAARGNTAPMNTNVVATAKAVATWTRDTSVAVIGSTPAACRNYWSDLALVARESWNAQR